MSATAPDPTGAAPYRLRPAIAGDAAWLYELHVASMKDYVAQTWGWDDAVQQRMFAEGFAPDKNQIFVVDGQDAGVVEVLCRTEEFFIATIEVAPRWQGRGLGTAILRGIQAVATCEGRTVRLQVLKVNPARHLYERLGFGIVGETATHYLMATAPRADEAGGSVMDATSAGPVPAFRLNFEEAFRAIARDPNWLGKLALGALFSALSLVIVGVILVEGYMLIYMDRVSRAEPLPLPEWDDFGEILRRGAIGFVVRLAYGLPIALLALLIIFGTAFLIAAAGLAGSNGLVALSSLTLTCGVFAIIPLALLAQALTPAGHAQLVLHNSDMRAAFDFGEVFRFIGRHKGQYALMILLTLAAGSVLNQIGYLACFVGIFVTSFVVQLFSAHLVGQLCWYERTMLRPAGAGRGRRA